MKKPVVLFVQGGGEGAYEADRKLVSFLREGLGEACVKKTGGRIEQ